MVTNVGGLRFHVESSSKADVAFYSVEFKDQNGECNCRDFVVRCKPLYRERRATVEYSEPERTRCKHINQVLLFIANKAVCGCVK